MTLLFLRAPLLLLRRPGVAAALFFAALVALAPAAGYPMLQSSASAAAFHNRATGGCAWTVGSQFTGALDVEPGHLASIPYHERTDLEAKAFTGVPRMSAPVKTLFRDNIVLDTPHGADPATIRLAFRTGVADHVQVLSGPTGDGLWVPSRLATKAQLKIGDPVSIDDFHSTVAAIYADQRDTGIDPDWWCSTSWLYAGRPGEGTNSPLPDLLLAPEATVLAAESTIGSGSELSNGVQIDRTVDITGTTQAQGRHLADTIVAAQKKVVGGIIDDSRYTPNRMRSDLDPFTARSALVGSSVAPVIAALSIAGSAVGLLALASATSFWVRRRRRELIVLATHGVGSLALGGKAVLESLPAIALGGVAGGAGAWLAIRDGGPSPYLDVTSIHRGILIAAAVLVLCLLVVMATAAAGARALIDVSPGRRQGSRWRHVPWELAVIAGAAALWTPLGSAHQSTLAGDQPYGAVASFPLRLFVTPPLILLGTLVLLVRLAAWWLSRSPGATARPAKKPTERPAEEPGEPEEPQEPRWQPAGPAWVVEAAHSPARATAGPAWVTEGARGSATRSSHGPASEPARGSAAHSSRRTAVQSSRGSAAQSSRAAESDFAGGRGATARKAPRRRGAVGLLVWRRLGRDAVAAAILAVATGVPVGLAVFGAFVGQTASGTLVAQAELQNGADVVIHLSEPAPVPAGLRGQATPVRRADHVELGDRTVSVLEIDPATFAHGAYWDDRLGGGSLADLAADVSATEVVAAVPALPGDEQLRAAAGPALSVHVRTVPLLPASQGGYPTALVPTGVLDKLQVSHIQDIMLWVRGDPADIHRKALAAHLPILGFTDATELYQHTWIEPVTYTFAYTIAISTLMGLITTVGLVLYLEAGMPARKRAWVMLRRMGLPRGGHWRALLAQIALPVLFGAVLGGAFAATAAVLTRPDMDIDDQQPPAALLAAPDTVLTVVGLVVVLVVATTVLTTHLRTVHAHPSVVLRDVG